MLATSCVVGNAIEGAWEGDCGSAPCLLWKYVYVPCPYPRQMGCDAVCGVVLVNAAGVIRPAVTSCRARRTSSAPLVQQIYNMSRQTESDGGTRRVYTSRVWGVVEDVRGRGGADVVSMPYLSVFETNLHAGTVISIVPHCDSSSASAVCASLGAQMASGCGGVSRMKSCLDNGGDGGGDGADVSAKPCLSWALSLWPLLVGNGPPLNPHGCGAAPSLYLHSRCGRANGLSRVWSMASGRCRACFV